MLDFNALFEFSRTNCIGICTFLVPANLIATSQTLIFAGIGRSQSQVRFMMVVSCIYALMMVLHVATWFMIGVVMIPTYVLLGLGCTCLSVNVWAIAHPLSIRYLLKQIRSTVLSFGV